VKRNATILALLTASATSPLSGWAQQAPPGGGPATVAAIEQAFVDTIARAERSVVAVARSSPAKTSVLVPQIVEAFGDLREPAATTETAITTAAGVIIDPAGLVLTEYLAVHDGDQHTITTIDGKIYPANIKAADPRSSLAIIEITPQASPLPRAGAELQNKNQLTRFPAIPFGDAAKLRKGQFVIAIGNPYAIRSDGEPTASWGTVTNLARKAPVGANLNDVPGPQGDYRTSLHHLGTLIQTDAKLGWSAGGGALVNMRGELVGLTTTVASIAGHEQPAGYAIPIDDTARRIIDTLKQGREVEYGLLGVSFRPTDASYGEIQPSASPQEVDGVTVLQVYPGSPAAHSGLESGDIVTHVSGQHVDDVDSVQLAISARPPRDAVEIAYRRGDQTTTVTATLAKLAVPGRKIYTDAPPSWRGLRVEYATALDAAALGEQAMTGAIDPAGCVLVAEVAQDSPAWQAGIRPRMFISHVGKHRVTTPQEFQAASEEHEGPVILWLTQPLRHADQTESNEVQIP
jgi:serine protease Do